jgi:hypothetical protein
LRFKFYIMSIFEIKILTTMANIYLTKDEIKWLTDLEVSEDHIVMWANIWKKCNDKLEFIECSKEIKKLNELQEQIDKIKKSIKDKSRGWGIK